MQTANGQYNTDMQTAASNEASKQLAADNAYNASAQPLTDAYNSWLTSRTAQYNSDMQSLTNTLNGELASEDASYNAKVATYAATLQSGTQAATDAYNNGVAGLSAARSSDDQAAYNTYSSNVAGAQQTLDTAEQTYQDTVNQIYQNAEQNGTDPDQSALAAAYATLEAANHAFSNATAGFAVTLQSSLGDDANSFAASEGPLYVTEQDAIASAQGDYDTSEAAAAHTRADNDAQDEGNADGQAASIAAIYDNDVETHYEVLQLDLAPFVQTRENSYADAAQQYADDSLTAWAKLMNAQDDATQSQTKSDTAAYAQYAISVGGPWQTLQEQLAQADADLADATAKANTAYNTSVMAADIEEGDTEAEAQEAFNIGVVGETDAYTEAIAPAWAASIIAAANNDPGTTAWANAWAMFSAMAVSDAGSAAEEVDAASLGTEEQMLQLGTGLSTQVSAADKLLADEAGAAEVSLVTENSTAVLACNAVTVPAQQALAGDEIDNAHAEVSSEIGYDKQGAETHASDEDTRDKGYSAAQTAFVYGVDQEIASDDEAERTKAAMDTSEAAQDEVAQIKAVDAAAEAELDDMVPKGETLVDSEAKADKTYVAAEVQQAVDAGNAQAQTTAANVAAQPDSNFPQGETIGAPGIYIDISGIHASFMLPMFDNNNKLMGYKYFSFWDASWEPGNSGGGWFDITNYIGFKDAYIQTAIRSATFDPESNFDIFVPSTFDGVTAMLNYANKAKAGMLGGWDINPQAYDLTNGRTCVGFVLDTMDEADLWPNLTNGWLWTGYALVRGIHDQIPDSILLPNNDVTEYAISPPY